jgi:hypothetical protein
MNPYEQVSFRLAVGDVVHLFLPQSKLTGVVDRIELRLGGLDWTRIHVRVDADGVTREYPVGMVFPAGC